MDLATTYSRIFLDQKTQSYTTFLCKARSMKEFRLQIWFRAAAVTSTI